MIQYLKDFFTYEGRIGRKKYLIDIIGFFVIAILMYVVVFIVAAFILDENSYDLLIESNYTYLPMLIIISFPTLKRCHDLNWPVWIFTIYMFTEFLNTIFGVVFIWEIGSADVFKFEVFNNIASEWVLFLKILIGLTWLIPHIIGLILLFKKGITGSNKYGPNPLAG